MRPAAPGEIKVSHHLPAVSVVWLFRLIVASLWASPLVALLAATGIGHFPEGDALFFQPGGTHLLEALRLSLEPLEALTSIALWPGFVTFLLALLVYGGLLVALCHTGRAEPGRICRLAFEAFPALLVVSALTLLLRAGLLFFGLLSFGALEDLFEGLGDARHEDLWLLGWVLVLAGGWLFLGCVQDVSRATAVRTRASGWRSWLRGFKLVGERPLFTLVRFAGPLLGCFLLVLLGAWLVDLIGVEQAAGGRAALAFGAHQAIVFGLVFLRGYWLAGALELAVNRELPEH